MYDLFGRDLFGAGGLGQRGVAPGRGTQPPPPPPPPPRRRGPFEPATGIPRTVRTSYLAPPFAQSPMPSPGRQPFEPVEEPVDMPFPWRQPIAEPIGTEIVGMDLRAGYPTALRGGPNPFLGQTFDEELKARLAPVQEALRAGIISFVEQKQAEIKRTVVHAAIIGGGVGLVVGIFITPIIQDLFGKKK